MSVMTKHGVSGYRTHACRCKVCVKAYEEHLATKRDQQKGRVRTDGLPSVTNTLRHDTMTREEYDRLRMDEASPPRRVRGNEWLK